ncbi:HVO_0476 family zinc finger protein [Methanobrevibacter curvatus]|uniref:Uncharacterized protein n=1 Tax=Methanobrevibacter curvatus TaxID=49547 RepID=A0A162FE88_9EURY|nr:HVO_0476 family zinc finger protein [Methanobrevibacter curvatus]KZX11745.1 hypothetical protein MBCUR_13340 [Methanobrevibacter curvatus]
MKCPICGSDDLETLKSKNFSSKKDEINDFLLKCRECSNVFKESVKIAKPIDFRLIISEIDSSKKTFIPISPDDELNTGDVLLSNLGQVEINSLELKNTKRVEQAIANDVVTIWATSLEIPARIGISVNLHGEVQSYKVDLERDFRINVDDIIKIEDYVGRVQGIKTDDRKMNKGGAKASIIKRVYIDPVRFKNHDYDLTKKIASKKITDKFKKI